MVTKKTQKKYSLLGSFTTCYSCAPVFTLLTILDTLITSLLPFIQIIAFARFIDESIAVVTKGQSILSVITPLVLVLAAIGYNLVGNKVMSIVWIRIELALKRSYSICLINKSARLQYNHMENPEKLDLIIRVTTESEIKMRDMYKAILDAITLFAQIISIFILIFIQSWWIAILIFLVSVPLLGIAIKAGKNTFDTNLLVTKYRRRFEYISEVLSSRDAVEERTLFGYTGYMNKKWHGFFESFCKIENRTILINNFWLESGSIITTILTVIIVLFLLSPYFNGSITIGLFMSLIVSIFNLIEAMSFQFTEIVRNITSFREYVKELNKFFELSEEPDATEMPGDSIKFESLEFKNVRFKYPGTDRYILNGLSFAMEDSNHYAFVGANGAGKTTIIKLLTGLYRDYDGQILLNGKNLKEYELGKLKSIFSIIYQDFAKYAISVKENIMLGSVLQCSEEDITDAVQYAGLTIIVQKLPDGMNTNLGRVIDGGQELSGGEWQRVAIARAIVNKNGIQILDEPTSALDPLMENKIYEDFHEISKSKTTILISHRLGSTKLADTIFVISDGKVAESGSHDILMKSNSIYSEMYRSQRKWYE